MVLPTQNNQAPFQSTISLVLNKLQSAVSQALTFASQIVTSVQQTISSFRFYPPQAVKQFNEMVYPRNVPGETNRRLIAKEIATSVIFVHKLSLVTEYELLQFLKVIDTLDFKHAPPDSILFSPKLPHIALEALRLGLLDSKYGPFQVATVLQWWSALQYHSQLQTISIFDPRAEGFIRQTLLHSTNPNTEIFLVGDQFDHFMQKMKALPPSEQRFLLVPDTHGPLTPQEVMELTGNPLLATISQATRATGVNVFNRLIDDLGNQVQMVSSTGMKQAFVETQYGDDAVLIKPRLYLSTGYHVTETRLTDSADMMVPTPDDEGHSRCPPTADGFLAPWHEFTEHDFYHIIITSAVGKTYRSVGVQAANTIRDFAKTCPEAEQKGLRQLAISFVDMDYVSFHNFALGDGFLKVHAFWLQINLEIMAHKRHVETFKVYTEAGLPSPVRKEPISEENEVNVFEVIYQAFVVEKRGPAEITKESFHFAALSFLNEIDEKDLNNTLAKEEYEALRCSPIVRFLDRLEDKTSSSEEIDQ
jgi:hypothetical protein